MAEKIYELTQLGLAKLHDELNERKTTVAADIAERLKEARALGDLTENSEYDDAKDAQAQNELRIMEIEKILKNSRVIDEDEISKSKVTIGSQVKLKDETNGDEMEYILVGAKEEDIFSNRISNESPVGQAIAGKKKGHVVDVQTPSGKVSYKIVKISKPSN